jgi:LPXTG-site transpeptidase (sortase) family protein
VDWVYALGYPITEPFWVKARVGGQDKDVLIQAFERRVLSYTPSNAAGWQVEMGNVGRHYDDWRYHGDKIGILSAPVQATRIVVPKAKVDSRIIPVYVQNDAWEVADYAVGWLYGTVQPGQVGNSVFSGHNNYRGEVFRYLELLKPGDTINVWTLEGKEYSYQVESIEKLQEAGASIAERLKHGKVMDATPTEQLTLITCWPYTTYTHRLIVTALPED